MSLINLNEIIENHEGGNLEREISNFENIQNELSINRQTTDTNIF